MGVINMPDRKEVLFMLILFITNVLAGFGNAGALFWEMHISTPPYQDYGLGCYSFGFQFYTISKMGQRLGGFGSLIISSDSPETYVFGGVTGGLYCGQEFILGPLVLSANILAGLGATVSNIGTSAGHIAVLGEVHLEAGFFISEWLQLTCFGGFQSVFNLFPSWPTESYLFYVPVWGIKLCRID
jgi:hypothetical protein